MSEDIFDKYRNTDFEDNSEKTFNAESADNTAATQPEADSFGDPITEQYSSQPYMDHNAVTADRVEPAPAAGAPYDQADPSNPYIRSSAEPIYAAPKASEPVNVYSSSQPSSPYGSANSYVDSNGYYHRSFTEHRGAGRHSTPRSSTVPTVDRSTAPAQRKKDKAKMSGGAVAAILIVCILLSGLVGFGAGFGGNILAKSLGGDSDSASSYDTVSDELVIHKVNVENSSESTDQLVDKDTDQIVTEVADSVVEITTEVVQTNSFYGQYIAQGAGSGVIISKDGYIVTNNHVIEDASNITVTLRNGDSYEAKLVGTDAEEDIALIKIEASDLTIAVFGDSDTLKVGDTSIIIGNPLGTLGGSVTEGIVSALDRSIVIDGKTMHLMQTDAAINPGNSGGGMFNGQGELVGIVVAKSGGSTSSGSTIDNIGFVIPINNVLNILGDLKQYGYVRGKADSGMSFVDITNQMYAWYYFNSYSTGVYISSVDRGSNAANAGFSAGDRVVSVDGKSVESASDITSIISSHSAGDVITFEIERGGRTGTIDLTLEEYVPDSNSAFSGNGR